MPKVAKFPYAIALVLLGVAVYAGSLTAPFVFDDNEAIVQNPFVRSLSWSSLSAPRDTPVARRPLVALSFALNYTLSGTNPRGYRAGNILLHILNGLLILELVRRTLRSGRLRQRFGDTAGLTAFAAATVWVVHPLHTDAVTYVTQRTELMMAFFALATMTCASVAIEEQGRRALTWSVVSVASCALGMLCKESMATVPVLVFLYDVAFVAGSAPAAWRRRRGLYIGLASTWLVMAALVTFSRSMTSRGFSGEVTPWTYLLLQPRQIAQYLRLTFWPHRLVFDYGLPGSTTLASAVPYGALMLVLLLATLLMWRRRREVGFLGAWFFITLAPASSVVPVATEVGAERRMYLPLVAIAAGVAVVAAILASRVNRPWLRQAIVGGLAIVCVGLGWRTVLRNRDYQDPVVLWRTSLDRYPQPRAHFALGVELARRGDRTAALNELKRAADGYPKADYALGVMAEEDSRHVDALEYFTRFVELRPEAEEAVSAYVGIGRARLEQGQYALAVNAFEQARRMNPSNIAARSGLVAAHTRAGLALVSGGDERTAVDEFRQAADLEPDASHLENLAHALAANGRMDEAVTAYERAIRLAPGKASLQSALGVALVGLGKTEEGMTRLQHALELAPDDPAVREDVAIAYELLQRKPVKRR